MDDAAGQEVLPSMPLLPITSEATLASCRALDASAAPTVFIASFPKSGTTWVQNVCFQILSAARRDDAPELELRHISDFAPFYEADRTWGPDGQVKAEHSAAQAALGFRLFNTHLRPDMLPAGARCIYVVREVSDVCTSFYHHMSNQHPEDGGFEGDAEAFLEAFLKGEVAFGKWPHHLMAWMPEVAARPDEVLLLSYEDLKADPLLQLSRVAAHLGVSLTATALRHEVLPRVSFGWMKANLDKFQPVTVRWKEGFQFIRKGVVGDARSLFSPEQLQRMAAVLADDFGGEVPEYVHDLGLLRKLAPGV